MTPQQTVGLGVRLFAIFIALEGLKYLVSLPVTMANNHLDSQTYLAYGFGFLCIAIAVLLWCFPMVVASKIVPRTRFENRINLQALDAAAVGGSLIGLWFFANAFLGIVWHLFRGAIMVTLDQSIVGSFTAAEKAALLFDVAELILACILIFKSHVFATIAMRKIEPLKGSD